MGGDRNVRGFSARINVKHTRVILLLWFLFAIGSWLATALAQQAPSPLVRAVASIGMTVSDMDHAVAFYSEVLSFKKISDVEVDGEQYERLWGVFGLRARVVRMQLGDQALELLQFLAPPDVRPIPVPSYSNDLWFQHFAVVVRNMDAAWQHLRKHHVRLISPRPQTIPKTNPAAGIRALKFRDPDGHNLELLWFPEGKGDGRWHRGGVDLFMGIDHTAMTVRSTENSLKFYHDLLGLEVAGNSLNVGNEQEHLDSLRGARVRVTGLKPLDGPPGIEFLEYELPAAGRPMPADVRPNDLVHWQVTLVVDDVEMTAKRLRLGPYAFVSMDLVSLPDDRLGFKKGFLVRDPDGHVMQIIER